MATKANGGLQVPIFAFLAGSVLLVSFLRGQSVMDVLAGVETDPLDPKGAKRRSNMTGTTNSVQGPTQTDASAPSGGKSGTPKEVIDTIVLPIARKHGINRSVAMNNAANAAHSLSTTSGNRSDHKGPPTVAWAADMSNGGSPTPEMDALAAELARTFNLSWSGAGAVSGNWNGYRIQMIYRSQVGGNHDNHVHLGVKKL